MASNKIKRIDIKHHYIRELVDARTIADLSVGMACMVAYGLIKALPEPKYMMILGAAWGRRHVETSMFTLVPMI
jgi:hypothetical protein